MVDIVPEWEEATNIKLGANKVSSVVMSSSIATSVTMWVLKRQINRNKAEPTTNFSQTPNYRGKDKIAGWRLPLAHQIFDTNHENTRTRLCLFSIFESFSRNSSVVCHPWRFSTSQPLLYERMRSYANSRVLRCRKPHYANNLTCQ